MSINNLYEFQGRWTLDEVGLFQSKLFPSTSVICSSIIGNKTFHTAITIYKLVPHLILVLLSHVAHLIKILFDWDRL